MNVDKTFAIAASVVVAAAVAAGLYLGGSPGEQRLYRFDERRIGDLQGVSSAILASWDQAERLPPDLTALAEGSRLGRIPRDPETGSPYTYEIVSENSYRLCAEFSRPARNPLPGDFWAHDAGYQCFEFTLAGPQAKPAGGAATP